MADEADGHPLDEEILAAAHLDGPEIRVGGVEEEPPALAPQALDRHLFPEAGHHDLTRLGKASPAHGEEVAIEDAGIAHALPLHPEQVIGHRPEQSGRQAVAALDVLGGEDRPAGGDPADQRHPIFFLGQQPNAPGIAGNQGDRPLGGERLEMLLSAGRHPEAEVTGDLGPSGGIAALGEVAADEVEDFALTGGELIRHGRKDTINPYGKVGLDFRSLLPQAEADSSSSLTTMRGLILCIFGWAFLAASPGPARLAAERAIAAGDLEKALVLLEEAWARLEERRTGDLSEREAMARAFAAALAGLGRYGEAEAWLARLEALWGPQAAETRPAELAGLKRQRAVLARVQGEIRRAEGLLAEAEALAEAAGERRLLAAIAVERAELARSEEALGPARRHLGSALSQLEALHGPCHPELLPVLDALARLAREEEDAAGWRLHAELAAECASRLALPEAAQRWAELR